MAIQAGWIQSLGTKGGVDVKCGVEPSGPSQADRELAAQASRLGVEVTPRQVERWREDGYLQVIRRGRGRGLGTVAFYPPQAAEQAADLARAIKDFGRLDEAALAVFLHGHSIKERALKRAYASAYSRIRRFLKTSPGDDPFEVASRFSRAFSRRSSTSETAKSWRAQLRSKGKAAQFTPAAHDIIYFFLGGAGEGDELSPEVFEALGLEETIEILTESERTAVSVLVRQLSLPALEAVVKEANVADLEGARDELKSLLHLLFGDEGATFSRDHEFVMAVVGVPAVLRLGAFFGAAFAAGIARLQEEMNTSPK
jgi:hypothetical protein